MNYGPSARCDLPASFENTVLLEHSHTLLFTYSVWLFHNAVAELRSYDKDCMAHKA